MGFTELAIIGLFAAVLFFGGKKIPEIFRSAGRASEEFKKGKLEAERELKEMVGKEEKK